MKIIITGGTGLIGRALAADLAAGQNEVIVLTRNPNGSQKLPDGVSAVVWDGKSANGWGQYADGADAIVNLAGESIAGETPLKIRWTEARKKRILESRLNAGKAVVEAVANAVKKPGVVIQSSAVGYYGARSTPPFDEDAPAGNDYLAGVCKDWEASTSAVEGMGVRRVVIRTGVVLSKDGGALPLQMLPFLFFAGGPIGNGRQGYPWIHIRDEVKAIRFLIENPFASGVYNLTAPKMVNNAEFSKSLGRALNRPAFIPTPAFVFQLAFGEAATILVDGQLPQPRRLLQAGFQFQFSEAEPALRDLLQKK